MATLDALPTKTALGFRRSRFAKRQPLATRIEYTKTVEEIIAVLKRHPKLPAPYLFKLVSLATGIKSYPRFQDLLTTLYNGTIDGLFYLDRPEPQFNNMNARYQPFVYSLPGEKGGGWFVHQLMGSCISASMEIACREKDLTYFSRRSILAIKHSKMELRLPSFDGQKKVVPDDLGGIGYSDRHTLVFPREDSRATEAVNGRILEKSDEGKKLLAYIYILRNRVYEQVWGVTKLKVLFPTVTKGRKETLQTFVQTHAPDLSKEFLFKVFPDFGKHWKIPAIYTDILLWERADGKPFDISVSHV